MEYSLQVGRQVQRRLRRNRVDLVGRGLSSDLRPVDGVDGVRRLSSHVSVGQVVAAALVELLLLLLDVATLWALERLSDPGSVHLGEGHQLVRVAALGLSRVHSAEHVLTSWGATGQSTAHISQTGIGTLGTAAGGGLSVVSVSGQRRLAFVLAQLLHGHLVHDGALQVD